MTKLPDLTKEQTEKSQEKLKEMFQPDSPKFSNLVQEWAYLRWEKAGRPEGRSEEFWYAAEEEMRNARYMALIQLEGLSWKYKYLDLYKMYKGLVDVLVTMDKLEFDEFKAQLPKMERTDENPTPEGEQQGHSSIPERPGLPDGVEPPNGE